MGFNVGAHDYGGLFLVGVWVIGLSWLALCWTAFFYRETDTGIRLTKIDEAVRYVVIPALAAASIASLMGGTPFTEKWYATKILIYSGLLVIGLLLRFIMRHWTTIFRQLAIQPTPALEAQLGREIALGRGLAYVYWIGIASVAFLGATKPF
jgi:hypothetical protein